MRRPAIALAAVLVACAIASAGALARGKGPSKAPRGVTVTGNVSGLYPGSTSWLRATVRNPYRRRIRVTSLAVEVRRARPACAGSNVAVRPFRGWALIRARRARVIRLRVRMRPTAAPQCKGARFPLVFRARAVLR